MAKNRTASGIGHPRTMNQGTIGAVTWSEKTFYWEAGIKIHLDNGVEGGTIVDFRDGPSTGPRATVVTDGGGTIRVVLMFNCDFNWKPQGGPFVLRFLNGLSAPVIGDWTVERLPSYGHQRTGTFVYDGKLAMTSAEFASLARLEFVVPETAWVE